MPYVRKIVYTQNNLKAFKFLMKEFDCNMSEAQKWIDRGRVYLNNEILTSKSSILNGKVEVIFFDPISSGLKPIMECEDFAVFDKPSGIMIHPKMLDDELTLNDDIKSLFGKNANAVHRIDKGTSGLVLVSKNKNSERELKALFANRKVKKSYNALVFGRLTKEMRIDANLKSDIETSKIRIKSHVSSNGKRAITDIKPLKYLTSCDMSIVEASPQTGRTHQIRAHLFHVKHSIVGDIIYSVGEEDTDKFLSFGMSDDEKIRLARAKRLMLHANYLSFKYRGKEYNIKSKIDFEELVDEFCNC